MWAHIGRVSTYKISEGSRKCVIDRIRTLTIMVFAVSVLLSACASQATLTRVIEPSCAYRIASDWGDTRTPSGKERTIGERYHSGIDFTAPIGTPVRAVAEGTIEFVRNEYFGGNVVRIYHGQTSAGVHVISAYAHLHDVLVSVGDRISRGQVIGTVGMTGRGIDPVAPHLHLAVIETDDPDYPRLSSAAQYSSGRRVDGKKYFPRVAETIFMECFEPSKRYEFTDIKFTHPVTILKK